MEAATGSLAAIQRGFEERDFAAVENAARFWKDCCRLPGTECLAGWCALLEDLSHRRQWFSMDELLAQTELELQRLWREWRPLRRAS